MVGQNFPKTPTITLAKTTNATTNHSGCLLNLGDWHSRSVRFLLPPPERRHAHHSTGLALTDGESIFDQTTD